MRLPIAREGYPFILVAVAVAIVFWLFELIFESMLATVSAVAATLLALAIVFFFRDPDRTGPRGADLVIAPADGRVVLIDKTREDTYLGNEALRVSIFLSLLDVHVNRYPVSGHVEHREFRPGRFEPAWRTSASLGNEGSSTGIRSPECPVLVRQIAGLAAKRVVTYARIGDDVRQGERMGIIRFGSRVDVYLPTNARPEIAVGQRAAGGVTVIARLATRAEET